MHVGHELGIPALLCRENGQATVEYAILTALAAVALVVTFMNAQQAITCYYYDIAALVCLPVP